VTPNRHVHLQCRLRFQRWHSSQCPGGPTRCSGLAALAAELGIVSWHPERG
jgi:hypothetical protein